MYNPNQPRVPAGDHHGGRWTSTGFGGGPAHGAQIASSAAMTVAFGTARVFAPSFVPYLSSILSRLSFGAAGPIGMLGALLVPANQNNVSEGLLPEQPDIIYRYDEGVLTLWQNVPGERKPLLFHGHADEDDLYRLPDGTIIARDLGHGILLNEAAAGSEKKRRAATRADAASKVDEPEICPAPTLARPNNDNIPWQLYQEQITGLNPKYEVVLNGVSFDGCRNEPGRIVPMEAKGPGYADFFKGGTLPDWFSGKERLRNQLLNQSAAARNTIVEWHIAEEPMANYIRKLAEALGCANIVVKYTPPVFEVTRP